MPVLDTFRRLCAAGHFKVALEVFVLQVARVPPEVLGRPKRSRRSGGQPHLGDVCWLLILLSVCLSSLVALP